MQEYKKDDTLCTTTEDREGEECMMKRSCIKKGTAAVLAAMMLATTPVQTVWADTKQAVNTNITHDVRAVGQYKNWDGVSSVAQFTDEKGNYCYAYDGEKEVTVIRTNKGKKTGTVKLKKAHSKFGTVICDKNGNFYMVTGETNKGTDTSVNTIFISKYNKSGKLIKTVGDNGSSSLAWYYDSGFYTKIPFDGGTCDVAINGDILAVNYGREMHNGHQSNSVFAISMSKMTKVNLGVCYESHSFAQRIIPVGNQFIHVSEGDGYDRSFSVYMSDPKSETAKKTCMFDFWVKKGTLDNWDMFTLNDNFAQLGGLAAADDTHVALVGSSVKSLNANATKENQTLFIQIFNPNKDLTKSSAYYTRGTRKGLAGPNGNEQVTNYGVKWLTSGAYTVKNPQVVTDSKGRFIILFERYDKDQYKGVYYTVVSKTGKILKKNTLYSKTATLNACEMPVCVKDVVYWNANKYDEYNCKMYVYSLKVD